MGKNKEKTAKGEGAPEVEEDVEEEEVEQEEMMVDEDEEKAQDKKQKKEKKEKRSKEAKEAEEADEDDEEVDLEAEADAEAEPSKKKRRKNSRTDADADGEASKEKGATAASTDGGAEARQLNRKLSTAASKGVEALLEELSTVDAKELNIVHCCTVLHRLSKLASTPSQRAALQEDSGFRRLLGRLPSVLKTAEAPSISLALHSCATLGISHEIALGALGAAVRRQGQKLDRRGLATTLWALAKLPRKGRGDMPKVLLKKAVKEVDNFTPQELANVVWALPQLGGADQRLLQKLALVVRLKVGELTPQGLGMVAKGFSSLGFFSESLFSAIADAAKKKASQCNAQDASQLLAAFAKVKIQDEALVAALCSNAKETQWGSLGGECVSSFLWALGSLRQAKSVDTLLPDLLERAVALAPQLKRRHLVMAMTALAKVAPIAKELGVKKLLKSAAAAIGEKVCEVVESLDPQDFGLVAWASALLKPFGWHAIVRYAAELAAEVPEGALSWWSIAHLEYAVAEAGEGLGRDPAPLLSNFTSRVSRCERELWKESLFFHAEAEAALVVAAPWRRPVPAKEVKEAKPKRGEAAEESVEGSQKGEAPPAKKARRSSADKKTEAADSQVSEEVGGSAASNSKAAGGPKVKKALLAGGLAKAAAEALVEDGFQVEKWLRACEGSETGRAWVPPGGQDCELCLVRYPSSPDALKFLLHGCATRLKTGGRLLLYGHAREGVLAAAASLEPLFEARGRPFGTGDGRILEAVRTKEAPEEPFEAWLQTISLDLGEGLQRWLTVPGLFASGKLDVLTELLLERLTPRLAELGEASGSKRKLRLLDFGCGNGALGAGLLLKEPSLRMTLVDSDAAALEAARRNAPTAHCVLGDGLACLQSEAVQCKPFDIIASNPPVHRGRPDDWRALRELLEQGPRWLRPGGAMWLVSQEHVPLGRLIAGVSSEGRPLYRSVLEHSDGRFCVWVAELLSEEEREEALRAEREARERERRARKKAKKKERGDEGQAPKEAKKKKKNKNKNKKNAAAKESAEAKADEDAGDAPTSAAAAPMSKSAKRNLRSKLSKQRKKEAARVETEVEAESKEAA